MPLLWAARTSARSTLTFPRKRAGVRAAAPELPLLSEMPNFTLRMVSAGFMHTWNLGVARDLIGSCLKICLKTQFWPGPNLSQRLKQLQRDINLFKKQRGLQMHLQQIKPSWAGADVCPEYKSSASDAAVMVRFLAYKLSLKAAPPPYEGLSACCTAPICFKKPSLVAAASLTLRKSRKSRFVGMHSCPRTCSWPT